MDPSKPHLPDHPRRCTARKSNGDPCGRWAIAGGTVCPSHGGFAPQVRAAAARRLRAEQLDADLDALLAELESSAADRSPVDVLLDAVHRAAAMVQVLGALVGRLRPDGSRQRIDGDEDHLWGPNHLGDGAPHVVVEMYATWLDRAARASKLAIEAGVEERLVRLAEEQGALVADLLRAVFDDPELGLTPAQRAAAAPVAARHLRRLDAAS